MQHRNEFADRIDHHPQPQRVRPAAQPGAQFIELKMRQGKIPKDAVLERLTMGTCAPQPGRDGRMLVPKHPHRGGDISPFR